MRLIEGLLFLFFGIGFLIVTWQALKSGEIPFGRGYKTAYTKREDEPAKFYVAIVFYICFGSLLILYAISILFERMASLLSYAW